MTSHDKRRDFELSSFLHGINGAYLESLYKDYEQNPATRDEHWKNFFSSLKNQSDTKSQAERNSFPSDTHATALNGKHHTALQDAPEKPARDIEEAIRQTAYTRQFSVSEDEIYTRRRETVRALWLIHAYRVRGYLVADLDPLGLRERRFHPELQLETYGFSESDLNKPIFLDGVLGLEIAPLHQIIRIVQETYCRKIGIEFMHITSPDQKAWIQERIEGLDKEIYFTQKGKLAILNKIMEAEIFERFLDLKHRGTKRFGLDGSEAMVPALEQIIKRGGSLGVNQIVFGMAHRGRLNVLANVMSKPQRAIFHEFMGGASIDDNIASGDVKYHLGASSDREFDDNRVHLSLTPNPSHLEAVLPVVLGKTRAKQQLQNDVNRSQVLPVLLHGDAAFAGQGVVAECFGLSQLPGHRVGGSVHFIINNQIGFTTTPQYARSSPYPSAIAKMGEAPIFHVNGDSPEAVVHVSRIATEYRQKFGMPVVIDMFCYRRHGHNEGDDPSMTQPLMYQRIRSHPIVSAQYASQLVSEGTINEEDVKAIEHKHYSHLEIEYEDAKTYTPGRPTWLEGRWTGLSRAKEGPRAGHTSITEINFKKIGEQITRLPDNFNVHRRVRKVYDKRAQMIKSGQDVDWAMAEALAFASLNSEGYRVRLSGQDVERGTFSHRHAKIIDQTTEDSFAPIHNVVHSQHMFHVINSMLSEYAILGFEYGYSVTDPNTLVLWEGQFGDFANGAQVIIDQFVSSAEAKWLRMSALVLLLPHGYEGQGPEHSSARLERYLQLSGEDNWQVANCTTPANYFHILRRQMHRAFRKPLVLMSPKSLLRHKLCVSDEREFTIGSNFHRILTDDGEKKMVAGQPLAPDSNIRRVILCSGKIYYDLYERREEIGVRDIQIIRLEQLYPFPDKALRAILARFPQAHMVWCQEEPANQGAWFFVRYRIEEVFKQVGTTFQHLDYVGRKESAATATGLLRTHLSQQEYIVNTALAP